MKLLSYVCDHCRKVFKAAGYGKNANLLTVWINCPGCRSEITLMEYEPALFQVINLSPEELFKASQGNGLPDEKVLTESNITRILTDGKIVAVELEDPTEQRVILNSLTVKYENKTIRLHLGSSNRGAALYKIVTEVP